MLLAGRGVGREKRGGYKVLDGKNNILPKCISAAIFIEKSKNATLLNAVPVTLY